MRISQNTTALRVFTNISRTNRAVERNAMRLSSGFRINTVADDPAGFSISLGLQWQVRSKDMADRNTMDGISLLETADAALQDVQDMLQRIRELAVAAANDTNQDTDRLNSQAEISNLLDEINSITRRVEFNNIRILNGEARDLRIQIGGRQGMSVGINIPSFRTEHLGLTNRPVFADADGLPTLTDTGQRYINANGEEVYWDLNVLTGEFAGDITSDTGAVGNPQMAIVVADEALSFISLARANIGAFVNRFEYTSSSLRSASEATSRSLSRILDTDMAHEMMLLAQNNILTQAGMAIMAQVNARPQQVLQLLG